MVAENVDDESTKERKDSVFSWNKSESDLEEEYMIIERLSIYLR